MTQTRLSKALAAEEFKRSASKVTKTDLYKDVLLNAEQAERLKDLCERNRCQELYKFLKFFFTNRDALFSEYQELLDSGSDINLPTWGQFRLFFHDFPYSLDDLAINCPNDLRRPFLEAFEQRLSSVILLSRLNNIVDHVVTLLEDNFNALHVISLPPSPAPLTTPSPVPLSTTAPSRRRAGCILL